MTIKTVVGPNNILNDFFRGYSWPKTYCDGIMGKLDANIDACY